MALFALYRLSPHHTAGQTCFVLFAVLEMFFTECYSLLTGGMRPPVKKLFLKMKKLQETAARLRSTERVLPLCENCEEFALLMLLHGYVVWKLKI